MESIRQIFTSIPRRHDTCQTSQNDTATLGRLLDQPSHMSIETDTWLQTAYLWAPYTCLSALIPLSLIFLSFRDDKNQRKVGSIARIKVYTPLVLTVVSMVQAAFNNEALSLITSHLEEPSWRAILVGGIASPITHAGLFGAIVVLTLLERAHGSTRKSWLLLVSWCVVLIITSRIMYSHVILRTGSVNNVECIVDVTRFLGVLLVFSSAWFSEMPPTGKPRSSHPEEEASWWSRLTLSWVNGVIWTGLEKQLEETDVSGLCLKDKCCNVVPEFERAWKVEEYRCKLINDSRSSERLQNDDDSQQRANCFSDGSKKEKYDENIKEPLQQGSLLKALLRTYGFKFFILQIMQGVLDMFDFGTPLLTAALLNHIQKREKESVWTGIAIAVALFVSEYVQTIGDSGLWIAITRLSRHMKTSLTMVIFKKAMSVRNECYKDQTNGEIVNLISEDCDRVFENLRRIFIVGVTPAKIVVAMYLLYIHIGWSMMVGLVVLIVLIPLNGFIANKMKELNNNRREVKDNRIKLMNEIINGIKVIKLYAWEKSFMDKVKCIRSQETETCVRKGLYHAAIDSMFRAIPFLIKVGALGAFLLLGGHVDATKGFVALSLFHALNNPLSQLALQIPGYMEAHLSLKRISKFLNGKDISNEVITKVSARTSAVHVKNGSFSWERSNPDPTLTDIYVDIPKGSLVAVVGMVGSGKSSLLASMLGEMEKLDGDVEIETQGKVAFVPQEAWILNASLQDNILFGSKMNQKWYRNVVHGCSLKEDINIMAAGDRTEIGEKGINLSGGQKQRVSLARAVYKDADLYLLDDPLSAVDAHVGKHIFNRVISHQGILKGKTRVLVTHGIHWLPFVDSIIVMKDGRVSENGSYDELLSRNGAFAQFLSDVCSYSSQDEDKKVQKMKQQIFQRLNSKEHQQQKDNEKEKEEIRHLIDNVIGDESSGEEYDDLCDNKNVTSPNEKLIEEEEMEQGSVRKEIYLDYLKEYGYKSVALSSFVLLVTIMANIYSSYVMKLWTDDSYFVNSTVAQTQESIDRSWHHFYSFVLSGLVEVVAAFVFIALTMKYAYIAARKLHDKLLGTILKCPMSFFDTTPSCRVVNRFSSDMWRIDGFSHLMRHFIDNVFSLMACLIMIIINVPVMLICLLPISGMYYFLHRVHNSSLRQLRRYTSKHRSPMFVHFSETLYGLTSIRAYSCQKQFSQIMETKIEEWSKFQSMELAVHEWFAARTDHLYNFIHMIAGIVVVMDTRMTASMAGLVLLFVDDFAVNLDKLLDLMAYTEAEFVALERVLSYTKKPIEAPWDIPENKPDADWPMDGRIVFNDYKARYRDGLDLVLKGVSCDVKDGEKIGIVGRTGAGKSSLTTALFRLIEGATGHIQVDSEKIAELGLHDLRSKITILPQDPVIFAGTVRMNLDPLDKCTTDELWVALQHSHLKKLVESLPNQLEFECGEGGKNFSVGQRQLLCLARTLLRHTKILVLDEATAAVDMETDELIQKTIRTEFKECTVLTIAHRLNTVMDYDRILVLDQGLVKEFDSPNKLLADRQSAFYSMAKDAKLVE